MATYIIGDIHGCAEDLQRLLTKVKFDATIDTAIFVGDLINRGPDSIGVIKLIWGLGQSAQVVLGNHDITLIAAGMNVVNRYPRSFDKILDSELSTKIIDWMRQLPLLIELPDYQLVVVHAGIPPNWSIKKAIKQANKASQVFTTDACASFLRHAYKSNVSKWNKSASEQEKFTYTINALTRVRYCKSDGGLDFEEKRNLGKQKKGLYPWFFLRSYQQKSKVKIVFGHWASLGYHHSSRVYCIDSGCVWGGKLTALKVQKNNIEKIQINSSIKP